MKRLCLLALVFSLIGLSSIIQASQSPTWASITSKLSGKHPTSHPPQPPPSQYIWVQTNKQKDGTTLYTRAYNLPSVGAAVIMTRRNDNQWTVKRKHFTPQDVQQKMNNLQKQSKWHAAQLFLISQRIIELEKKQ